MTRLHLPIRCWIYLLAGAGLVFAAIGCQKTITEPGEPEHGGVFLHSSVPAPTTR
jgi:hypothetical protein